MSLNLPNKVVDYLKSNSEKKFTAREIAKWITENYPEECAEKQQRSRAVVEPLNDMEGVEKAIAAEIGSQRIKIEDKHPGIKTTEGRPRKYYFTESTDIEEIQQADTNDMTPKVDPETTVSNENDLYPILSDYLRSELGVYSKRIDDKKSKNSRVSGGNKWLYPDLVGIEDLSHEWESEIIESVKQRSDKLSTLWSFEVKVRINISNVREAFFQAVSNSTWANYGYLVASEIQGDKADKELRMLAGLHGIGFILLNVESISESQIMIPAKERTEIDWDIANRLTEENPDFRDYIELLRQYYLTVKIKPADWD